MATPTIRIQGSTSGVFQNPIGGTFSGVGTNNFIWGVPITSSSSLNFTGKPYSTDVVTGFIFGSNARKNREFFSLGTLNYFNGTIEGGTGSTGVDLDITLQVSEPLNTSPQDFTSSLTFTNTPNTDDPIASADSVFLPSSNLPPVILTASNGAELTLDVFGFGEVTDSGFTREREFFVTEENTASAELIARFQNPCEQIIDGAVSVNTANSNRTLNATFTPNFGLSLDEAAEICGYDHFNWYQVITIDPYAPGGLVVPYVDPPSGGGASFGGFADNLPFYWDEEGATGTGYHLSDNETNTALLYTDTPAEPLLQPGESLGFNTSLVGILPDGSWDILYNFEWQSNYNGTSGGVTTRRNIITPDDNGTGEVFDIKLDLSAADLSDQIKNQMSADGAQNAFLSPNDSTSLLNTPINRFQNSELPGTYLFAGEEESISIRQNFPNFIEEGQAFKVAVEPGDDLIVMNRFQNSSVPGTYLYAGQEESISIRQNFPNFIEEGVAFYVYSGTANKGEDFYRFQNSQQPGTYLFVGEQERQSIIANFPAFIEEGVAFEVAI
jgi:hypothetical protein